MAKETQEPKGGLQPLIVIGLVVVVVVGLLGLRLCSDGAESAGGGERPDVAPPTEVERPEPPRQTKSESRAKQLRYLRDAPSEEMWKRARWNPPRPLRLVVRQNQNRTKAQARELAEEVRRRFLAGESSFALIRENSDRPRGIPQELIKRYENLRPDQASPVVELEDGFALFFGTPSEPPPELIPGGQGAKADGGR